MKKTYIPITIIIIILISALGISQRLYHAANKPIKVYVDDIEIVFSDAQPYIYEGRTMVPVRAIVEAMDIKVNWDSSLEMVTVIGGQTEIYLLIDKD